MDALADLLAFGASGKPSAQSSTYEAARMPVPGPRTAKLGNNGNTNGYQEWRCCRTLTETNPWWQVDLLEEVELSAVQLWKGMTYHEQPKNPDGRPPINWKASTARISPPTWIFVSSKPMNQSLDAIKADANVRAFPFDFNWESRIGSLKFEETIRGRYVRLQQESQSSSLQFAELEIFSSSASAVIDRNDGVYGFDNATGADFHEFIESGWLEPSRNESELRLWVGSFNEKSPAVQWADSEKPAVVSVELVHEKRDSPETNSWEKQTVANTSSALLDKQSTELRNELEDHQNNLGSNVTVYLNNDNNNAAQHNSAQHWAKDLGLAKLVEPSECDKIVSGVKTVSFAPGDVILDYGQHLQRVFYVQSGEVNVCGAASSIGADIIGTISKGSFFNELALINRWARFPAAFRAKTSVTCEIIDVAALQEALGNLEKLRDRYIRDYASSTGFLAAEPAVPITDSTHAQVLRTKVPTDLVSGGGGVSALSHKLTLELYGVISESGKHIKDANVLGSVSLLLSQINAHGEGNLTLPIVKSGDVVGQITISYLIVKPFAHAKNNLSLSWRSYWRSRAPLTGGHRGMGRCFYQVNDFRYALTRENTLASLILAKQSGADFVEFDVQLTKDRVPVIYHDFVLNVGLEDSQAWSQSTRAEEFEVGIHDLTLRQLTRSWTGPLHRRPGQPKGPQLKQLIKKHWTRILEKSVAPSIVRPIVKSLEQDGALSDEHLVAFFPQLKDLLRDVPAETGLNIEIKYPDDFFRSAMRASSCFAMNAYVDEILRCVFDNAGSRRIFFSCFDPNVCVLLRSKQTRYPVLFLTYGSMKPTAFDARLTLQFAVNMAKMERFQGIVSGSDDFIATPLLARVVKEQLRGVNAASALLTWGDQNTNHECVQLQKRAGIDGIISDNVIDLVRNDKKAAALVASS